MLNTLEQGPCLVSAYLAAPCSDNGQHNVLLTLEIYMRVYQPVQHLRSLLCFHSNHT